MIDPSLVAQKTFEDVVFSWPTIFLAATAGLVVLQDLFEDRQTWAAPLLTLLGLASALFLLLRMPAGASTEIYQGMAVLDPFAWFFQVFFVVVTAIAVAMSFRSREIDENRGEYFALMLVLCLGMIMLASANDLIMVYLALETVSIVSYVLTGWKPHSRKSSEASLKYVLYGAVASGVMLYGLSLLYGMAGSTDFHEVAGALAGADGRAVSLASLLVFTGFAYKIASVPFHMWAPDVYEGAPTPVTAFLTVGPKAAGFAALIRFFYVVLAVPASASTWSAAAVAPAWPALIAILSIATMTVGNLSALGQNNMKRLLGYSSIAHAGYMLMGFVVLSHEGLQAVLFYLVVYCAMNIGAFLVVGAVADATGSEDISAFRGLGTRSPFAAVSMSIFLFSLIGLPPLAGFAGKLQLFAGVIHAAQTSAPQISQLYWALVLFGLVNSVISLYYYARIVKAMFLESAPEGVTRRLPVEASYIALMGFLVVPTVLLGLRWDATLSWASDAIHFFGGT